MILVIYYKLKNIINDVRTLLKEGKIRFIGGDQWLLSLNIFLYDRYHKFPTIMINQYRVIA